MTVYLGTYFTASISAFLYSKCKEKYFGLCLRIVTFTILFIPLAIRYNIGTDYETYVRIVNNIINGHKFYAFEYGYIPIIWLIKNFNLDIQFFFIIPAFISLCIIFYIIPKKCFWFCIPAYICVSWIDSFSLVRQSFAAVIFLLSIKSMCDNKFLKAVLWGIVAGLFHTSLFFLLFLLLFTIPKWNVFSPYNNIFLFIILNTILALTPAAEYLMQTILSVTPYAAYINTIFAKKPEMGSGLGVLLKLLILLMVLFFSNRNKLLKKDIRYNLVIIFTFVFSFSQILSTQIHIFGRMYHMFDPFYIFMLIAIYDGKSKYKKWVILFIQLAMFLIYYNILRNSPSSAWGGLGLVPYVSIFSAR